MKFEDAIRLSKIQLKNTTRENLEEICSSSDTDEQDNKTVSDGNNNDLNKRFHEQKRNSLYNYDLYGVKSIGDIYTQNSYRDGQLKEFDDAKVISIVPVKIIQNNSDLSSVAADRILDKAGDKTGNFYEFKRKILPKIDFRKRDYPNNLIKIESQKMTLINNNKEKEVKGKFISQTQLNQNTLI